MKLSPARAGELLVVRQREVSFSFFPMRRTTGRWGLHTRLYATEPWGVIDGSVVAQVASGSRGAAQSFVRQAHEYYVAADRAQAVETRPLLYYYAFLNLAKALALSRGRSGLVGRVHHGIHAVGGTPHTPQGAEVHLGASTPKTTSAVDEVHLALTGSHVTVGDYPIRELIQQSVTGHRLWSEAANRRERFVAVEEVVLLHDPAAKRLWPTVLVRSDTLKSRGRGVNEVLSEAALEPAFRVVTDTVVRQVKCRTFELIQPIPYTDRPADVVMAAVDKVRPVLWATVTSAPPYRRYFLYMSPQGEVRVPQWLSTYAILFWLGSLTRYQPMDLLAILDGSYGAFFREFLASHPSQLLYLWASEFKQQEVAKAAVV